MCQTTGLGSDYEKARQSHHEATAKLHIARGSLISVEEYYAALDEFNRTWGEYMDIVNANIPEET